MGYPNRRVPMTDVHGEPQQGGALPAQIWHDYMSAATEGHPCAPLDESNAGITFQPFYGKYASTGGREAEAAETVAKPKHHGASHGRKSEKATIEVQESPPPPGHGPPAPTQQTPASPPPSEPRTGGAAP